SNNGVSIRCYRQTVFLGQASRQLLRRSVGESLLPNVIAVRTSIRTEVHPLSIGRPRRVVAAAFRWTNQAHGPVAGKWRQPALTHSAVTFHFNHEYPLAIGRKIGNMRHVVLVQRYVHIPLLRAAFG